MNPGEVWACRIWLMYKFNDFVFSTGFLKLSVYRNIQERPQSVRRVKPTVQRPLYIYTVCLYFAAVGPYTQAMTTE